MANGLVERELRKGIDRLLADANGAYAGISDEDRIEITIADAELRDQIICFIEDIVRCRKVFEFSKDPHLKGRICRMALLISPKEVKGRLMQ